MNIPQDATEGDSFWQGDRRFTVIKPKEAIVEGWRGDTITGPFTIYGYRHEDLFVPKGVTVVETTGKQSQGINHDKQQQRCRLQSW